MQLDTSPWIVVRRRQQHVADRHVDGEFLAQLPTQARVECFIRLAFPAGKLPVAGQMHARLSAGDEIATVALNHRGGDKDGLACHVSARRGQYTRTSSHDPG